MSAFGPSILADDGEIDRKKLGAIVFDDPARLKALTDILRQKLDDPN